MSESPTGAAENPADDRAQALTPEGVEAVLADFRAWLEQVHSAPPTPPSEAAPAERVDLHTLLGQFLAVRHEVNLQTRAVRAQQEQNAETLSQLRQALETLQRALAARGQEEEASQEEALRPVLKTLVDLYDALALARRELLRVQETALPALAQTAEAAKAAKGGWRPWRPRLPAPTTPPGALAALAAGRVRQSFDSVVTGYTMSLQRVARALEQHGLEAIPCVGEPFDPEFMEVLEVATDSGRPAGEVVEEVRRGYLWRGRVFRYAQVRVAKPTA